MDDKLIVTLNVDELKRIIIECIIGVLNENPIKAEEDPLLKRVEVAKMFSVSLVTLNQWPCF